MSFFDVVSYIMGFKKGVVEGTGDVVIENGIVCTDDGNCNITITEE